MKTVPRDNRYLLDNTTAEDRIFLDTCVVYYPDPTGSRCNVNLRN